MKHLTTTCDRCHRSIIEKDARAADFLAREYPGRDICESCHFQIEMTTIVARESMLEGISQEQYLKQWAAQYDLNAE